VSRIIKPVAPSLVIGSLWVYERSREPAGVEIERDDGDEMLSLSIAEALALRDWLVAWMPAISMPRFHE
jgi:hypothetical protein